MVVRGKISNANLPVSCLSENTRMSEFYDVFVMAKIALKAKYVEL